MEKIEFCASCGRVISQEFLFCPFCGAKRAEEITFSELLEEPFGKMEKLVKTNHLKRLEVLEKRLSEIEEELNGFLYKKLCISEAALPKSK